jgi:hypothetical protein
MEFPDDTYSYMLALLGVPGLKSLYLQIPFYADFVCAVSGKVKCIYKEKLVFGTANAYSVKFSKYKISSIKPVYMVIKHYNTLLYLIIVQCCIYC